LRKRKLLAVVINSIHNVKFKDFEALMAYFGFVLRRTNGSHMIYKNREINQSLVVQNDKGKAKPYQVKQFLELIETHQIEMEE